MKLISHRYSLLCRLVALVLTGAIMLTSSPTGAELSPAVSAGANLISQITLPNELAAVREIYKGRGERAVILIQDAHVQYGAQKNIARALGHLSEKHRLDLIGAEGFSGPLDLSLFQAFPDARARENVFDRALKRGSVSGIEYFGATEESRPEIVGVDDEKLYVENVRQYVSLLKERASFDEALRHFEQALDNLKFRLYTPENRRLDRVLTRYADSSLHLLALIRELEKCSRASADIRADFPELSRVFSSMRTTDEPVIARSSPQANDEAISAQSATKRKIASPPAGARNDKKYSQDLEINAAQFSDELSDFIFALSRSFARSAAERELLALGDYLRLLRRGALLTLSRSETERFRALGRTEVRSGLKENLERLSREERVSIPPVNPVLSDRLTFLSERILSFYETAEERDRALSEELLRNMRENRKNISALVVGGYHSTGILRELKKKNISYAVLTPAFSEVEESDRYREIMTARSGALLLEPPSAETSSVPPIPALKAVSVYDTSGNLRMAETSRLWKAQQGERARVITELGRANVSDAWMRRLREEGREGNRRHLMLRSGERVFVEPVAEAEETLRLLASSGAKPDEIYSALIRRGDFIPLAFAGFGADDGSDKIKERQALADKLNAALRPLMSDKVWNAWGNERSLARPSSFQHRLEKLAKLLLWRRTDLHFDPSWVKQIIDKVDPLFGEWQKTVSGGHLAFILPQTEDWLFYKTTPLVDDDMVLYTYAESLAAYSPRASALMLSFLGAHLRHDYRPDVDAIDLELYPVLLKTVLLHLKELFAAGPGKEAEIRDYASALFNGLMVRPSFLRRMELVGGDIRGEYLQSPRERVTYFDHWMSELEKNGVPDVRAIMKKAGESILGLLSTEDVPNFFLYAREGIADVEIKNLSAYHMKTGRLFTAWDFATGKADAYYDEEGTYWGGSAYGSMPGTLKDVRRKILDEIGLSFPKTGFGADEASDPAILDEAYALWEALGRGDYKGVYAVIDRLREKGFYVTEPFYAEPKNPDERFDIAESFIVDALLNELRAQGLSVPVSKNAFTGLISALENARQHAFEKPGAAVVSLLIATPKAEHVYGIVADSGPGMDIHAVKNGARGINTRLGVGFISSITDPHRAGRHLYIASRNQTLRAIPGTRSDVKITSADRPTPPGVLYVLDYPLAAGFGQKDGSEENGDVEEQVLKAQEPLNRAVQRLSEAGFREEAEMIKGLFQPAVYFFYKKSEKASAIHHIAYVLDFMSEIMIGEGITDKAEIRRGMAAALLHDVGIAKATAEKVRKVDLEESIRHGKERIDKENLTPAVKKKKLARFVRTQIGQAILFRKQHMDKGSSPAASMMSFYNFTNVGFFSREDIREVRRLVEIHDNPSVEAYKQLEQAFYREFGLSEKPHKAENLFKVDDRLMMYLREADRLWMITEDGIQFDLWRKKNGEDVLSRAAQTIARYREEAELYLNTVPDAQQKYGFKNGTLFRSETGYRIFERQVSALIEKYKPAPGSAIYTELTNLPEGFPRAPQDAGFGAQNAIDPIEQAILERVTDVKRDLEDIQDPKKYEAAIPELWRDDWFTDFKKAEEVFVGADREYREVQSNKSNEVDFSDQKKVNRAFSHLSRLMRIRNNLFIVKELLKRKKEGKRWPDQNELIALKNMRLQLMDDLKDGYPVFAPWAEYADNDPSGFVFRLDGIISDGGRLGTRGWGEEITSPVPKLRHLRALIVLYEYYLWADSDKEDFAYLFTDTSRGFGASVSAVERFDRQHDTDLFARIAERIAETGRTIRILDLGAGHDAPLLREIKEKFGERVDVTAVDSAEPLIKMQHLLDRYGVRYIREDANEALDIFYESDERFDIIISNGALHLLKDPIAVIKGSEGLLSPGGFSSHSIRDTTRLVGQSALSIADALLREGYETQLKKTFPNHGQPPLDIFFVARKSERPAGFGAAQPGASSGKKTEPEDAAYAEIKKGNFVAFRYDQETKQWVRGDSGMGDVKKPQGLRISRKAHYGFLHLIASLPRQDRLRLKADPRLRIIFIKNFDAISPDSVKKTFLNNHRAVRVSFPVPNYFFDLDLLNYPIEARDYLAFAIIFDRRMRERIGEEEWMKLYDDTYNRENVERLSALSDTIRNELQAPNSEPVSNPSFPKSEILARFSLAALTRKTSGREPRSLGGALRVMHDVLTDHNNPHYGLAHSILKSTFPVFLPKAIKGELSPADEAAVFEALSVLMQHETVFVQWGALEETIIKRVDDIWQMPDAPDDLKRAALTILQAMAVRWPDDQTIEPYLFFAGKNLVPKLDKVIQSEGDSRLRAEAILTVGELTRFSIHAGSYVHTLFPLLEKFVRDGNDSALVRASLYLLDRNSLYTNDGPPGFDRLIENYILSGPPPTGPVSRTETHWVSPTVQKELAERMPTLHDILLDDGKLTRFLTVLSALRLGRSFQHPMDDLPPLAFAQSENGIFYTLRELRISPFSESFRRHLIFTEDRTLAIEIKMPGQRASSGEVSKTHITFAEELRAKYPESSGVVEPLFFVGLNGEFDLYAPSDATLVYKKFPLGIAGFRYERDGSRLVNVLNNKDRFNAFVAAVGKNPGETYIQIGADVLAHVLRAHRLGYGLTTRSRGHSLSDAHLENFRLLKSGRVESVADFGTYAHVGSVSSPKDLRQRQNETLSIVNQLVKYVHELTDLPMSYYAKDIIEAAARQLIEGIDRFPERYAVIVAAIVELEPTLQYHAPSQGVAEDILKLAMDMVPDFEALRGVMDEMESHGGRVVAEDRGFGVGDKFERIEESVHRLWYAKPGAGIKTIQMIMDTRRLLKRFANVPGIGAFPLRFGTGRNLWAGALTELRVGEYLETHVPNARVIGFDLGRAADVLLEVSEEKDGFVPEGELSLPTGFYLVEVKNRRLRASGFENREYKETALFIAAQEERQRQYQTDTVSRLREQGFPVEGLINVDVVPQARPAGVAAEKRWHIWSGSHAMTPARRSIVLPDARLTNDSSGYVSKPSEETMRRWASEKPDLVSLLTAHRPVSFALAAQGFGAEEALVTSFDERDVSFRMMDELDSAEKKRVIRLFFPLNDPFADNPGFKGLILYYQGAPAGLGTFTMKSDGKEVLLNSVEILHPYRRKGLGYRLVVERLRRAKDRGALQFVSMFFLHDAAAFWDVAIEKLRGEPFIKDVRTAFDDDGRRFFAGEFSEEKSAGFGAAEKPIGRAALRRGLVDAMNRIYDDAPNERIREHRLNVLEQRLTVSLLAVPEYAGDELAENMKKAMATSENWNGPIKSLAVQYAPLGHVPDELKKPGPVVHPTILGKSRFIAHSTEDDAYFRKLKFTPSDPFSDRVSEFFYIPGYLGGFFRTFESSPTHLAVVDISQQSEPIRDAIQSVSSAVASAVTDVEGAHTYDEKSIDNLAYYLRDIRLFWNDDGTPKEDAGFGAEDAGEPKERRNIFEAMWNEDETIPMQHRVKQFAEKMALLFAATDADRARVKEEVRRLRVNLAYEDPVTSFLLHVVSIMKVIHEWIRKSSIYASVIFKKNLSFMGRLQASVIFLLYLIPGSFLVTGIALFHAWRMPVKERWSGMYISTLSVIVILKKNFGYSTVAHEIIHWLEDRRFISTDLPLVSIVDTFLEDRISNGSEKLKAGLDVLTNPEELAMKALIWIETAFESEVESSARYREEYRALYKRKLFFSAKEKGDFEHQHSRNFGFEIAAFLFRIETILKRFAPSWFLFVPTSLFLRAHLFTNQDMLFLDRADNQDKLKAIYLVAFKLASIPFHLNTHITHATLHKFVKAVTNAILLETEHLGAADHEKFSRLVDTWFDRISEDSFRELTKDLLPPKGSQPVAGFGVEEVKITEESAGLSVKGLGPNVVKALLEEGIVTLAPMIRSDPETAARILHDAGYRTNEDIRNKIARDREKILERINALDLNTLIISSDSLARWTERVAELRSAFRDPALRPLLISKFAQVLGLVGDITGQDGAKIAANLRESLGIPSHRAVLVTDHTRNLRTLEDAGALPLKLDLTKILLVAEGEIPPNLEAVLGSRASAIASAELLSLINRFSELNQIARTFAAAA